MGRQEPCSPGACSRDLVALDEYLGQLLDQLPFPQIQTGTKSCDPIHHHGTRSRDFCVGHGTCDCRPESPQSARPQTAVRNQHEHPQTVPCQYSVQAFSG